MSFHPFQRLLLALSIITANQQKGLSTITKKGIKPDIISSLFLLIAFWCPNSVAPLPHYIFNRVELLLGKALLHNRAAPPACLFLCTCFRVWLPWVQHWKRGQRTLRMIRAGRGRVESGSMRSSATSSKYIIPPLSVTLHPLPQADSRPQSTDNGTVQLK